jgi:hypothetical protein
MAIASFCWGLQWRVTGLACRWATGSPGWYEVLLVSSKARMACPPAARRGGSGLRGDDVVKMISGRDRSSEDDDDKPGPGAAAPRSV